MSSLQQDDLEWRDPANWRARVFYYAPRDARAFVPKRYGWGITINFAHPLGVAFLVAVLALAGGVIYVAER